MPNAPVSFDDGFGNPVKSVSGKPNGNPQPETGDTKPNDPVQQPSRIAGIPTIDPLIYSDPGNDGFGTVNSEPVRRKRGRPPGSGNRTVAAPKATSNIAANLESLLLSVHIMGAAFFNAPELELDNDEAKRMSDAIKEVSKHYAMEMDPKKLALAELGVVCAGIYGPRVVAAWRKNKKEADERPKETRPQPANNPEAAQRSQAIKVENQMVAHADAQAWASMGVE